MAQPGDVLEHPITRERLTFLETSDGTGGAFTRIRLEVGPGGFLAMAHVHPRIHERFEVVSGEWAFEVAGIERRVGIDDTVTVPAGTAHAWRNVGAGDAVTFITFCPSLKTEEFFESFFGLAQDGLTDPKSGMPPMAWLALLMTEYGEDFAVPADPPLPILLEQLRPIAEEARRQGLRLPYPYPHERSAIADPAAAD